MNFQTIMNFQVYEACKSQPFIFIAVRNSIRIKLVKKGERINFSFVARPSSRSISVSRLDLPFGFGFVLPLIRIMIELVLSFFSINHAESMNITGAEYLVMIN